MEKFDAQGQAVWPAQPRVLPERCALAERAGGVDEVVVGGHVPAKELCLGERIGLGGLAAGEGPGRDVDLTGVAHPQNGGPVPAPDLGSRLRTQCERVGEVVAIVG